MFIKGCVWGASASLRVSKKKQKTVRIVLSHLYMYFPSAKISSCFLGKVGACRYSCSEEDWGITMGCMGFSKGFWKSYMMWLQSHCRPLLRSPVNEAPGPG